MKAERQGAASGVLFPFELTPESLSAIADYIWLSDRLKFHTFGEQLAELHLRAVVTYPALAALMRSREVLEDVGASAARSAVPGQNEAYADAGARVAAATIAKYKRAIAAQLADIPGHELGEAARAYLEPEAA